MEQDKGIQLETHPSEGMTVSVGKAARILGTSSSTLKRKASEWGLTTFWDRRGRRYSVRELEEAKRDLLKPTEPANLTQPLEAIEKYNIPGGYRFRVYGGSNNKGYLGFYGVEQYYHIIDLLEREFGAGTYYLKLLDEDNRMTGYTFAVYICDPSDEDEYDQVEELRKLRRDNRFYKHQIRKLRETNGSS